MKKTLLLTNLLVAIGLFATACSDKSAVEMPQVSGAITFRALNDYAKTRGAEVTTNTMNQTGVTFKVWAQDEGSSDWRMNNVEVKYDGTSHFVSTSNYFWPDAGNVNFWAVHNNYAGTTIVNNMSKVITNFAPAAAHATEAMSDLQKDLVMAYGTGSKSANEASGMPLKFQHALSQIEFKAKIGAAASYDVYIAGVSIHNLDGTADVTFQSSADGKPTWANNSNAAAEKAEYFNVGAFPTQKVGNTAGKVSTSGSNFMLIPQNITPYSAGTTTGSFARVYIRVVEKTSGRVLYPALVTGANDIAAADIPLPAVNWEAGKKYIYTLDFSNGYGYKPFTPVEPNPNPGVTPKPVIPTPPTPTPTPTPVAGQPIKFTVTVVDWDTAGGGHTLNM